MPNKPVPAWEARSKAALPHHNAQDVHAGSDHSPEEFLQGLGAEKPEPKPDDKTADVLTKEHYFGSQAWEATSPAEQNEADVAAHPDPKNSRNK